VTLTLFAAVVLIFVLVWAFTVVWRELGR